MSNTSGLKSFSYSYNGSVGADSYSNTIVEEEGIVTFTCEFMQHEDYGEMSCNPDTKLMDRLNQLYIDQKLARWDGFE